MHGRMALVTRFDNHFTMSTPQWRMSSSLALFSTNAVKPTSRHFSSCNVSPKGFAFIYQRVEESRRNGWKDFPSSVS